MAGIVLRAERGGRPAGRAPVERLLAGLGHRGPDGCDVALAGPVALAHLHFWTTPEEVGERQPVADARGTLRVALDGRLDNRDELVEALARPDLGGASDALLVLETYRAWGAECFRRLAGPFAVVVVDLAARRLVCARDPVGDRTLAWHCDRERLLVASEPWALTRDPGVSADPDLSSLARFFGVEPPGEGRTYFAEVSELPPGHLLLLDLDGGRDDGGPRIERYWSWRDRGLDPPRSDREAVERFRSAVETAVVSRLRTVSAPAVLMSGGLDSTSVAAWAARDLRRRGASPLRTVSWVFDETPGADERPYLDVMARELGLEGVQIVGDGLWPLRWPERWPVQANGPVQDLYRLLRDAAFHSVMGAGGRTLLTGFSGDNLYAGMSFWLRSCLEEGRLGRALVGGARELLPRRAGTAGVGLRLAAARFLQRPARRRSGSPWLTPEAARELSPEPSGSDYLALRRRSLLDPWSAVGNGLETATAAAAGIDLRHPFRDRRLLELALALPAHLLHRPPWTRWVLREAMRGVLPEAIRLRRRETSLAPLAARGLDGEARATVRRLLDAKDAVWRRFVRADWLANQESAFASPGGGRRSLILWTCVCAELWRERAESGAFAFAA